MDSSTSQLTKLLSKSELQELVEKLAAKIGMVEGNLLISDFLESKKKNADTAAKSPNIDTKISKNREFDISKYRQRHIALHLQYNGTAYYGFASQAEENCEETIEKHLFEALIKLRLISDRKVINSRYG